MPGPERIHVVHNAADAIARFDEMGLRHTFRELPTSEQITTMLGRQLGRLFTLSGFADDPYGHVVLQIDEVVDEVVSVHNRIDPPFEGHYSVAAEPPPMISFHGDYLFDLITSD
jgi:hypothetical protein